MKCSHISHKSRNNQPTYTTLCIQSLLFQFLATSLDCLCHLLLCHCIWIETLHYCNVLQRVPLQHSLLYLLPVNTPLLLTSQLPGITNGTVLFRLTLFQNVLHLKINDNNNKSTRMIFDNSDYTIAWLCAWYVQQHCDHLTDI